MDPEEMCESCIHMNYCMGAYRKDHWCGNHTGHERKYEVSEMWKRYRMAKGPVEGGQQDNDM